MADSDSPQQQWSPPSAVGGHVGSVHPPHSSTAEATTDAGEQAYYSSPQTGDGYGSNFVDPGKRSKAKTSLIWGIVGLVVWLVTAGMFFFLSLPSSIVAIVAGHRAMNDPDQPQTKARAGFVMGVLGTILALLSLLAWIMVIAVVAIFTEQSESQTVPGNGELTSMVTQILSFL